MGERGEGKGNKDNFYLFCGLKSAAAAAATGKRRKMATAFLWEDDFLQFHFGFFFLLSPSMLFLPPPKPSKKTDGTRACCASISTVYCSRRFMQSVLVLEGKGAPLFFCFQIFPGKKGGGTLDS